MASFPDEIESIFMEFSIKLDQFLENLSGNAVAEKSDAFNLETFWENLVSALLILSHEASKLCVAFENPPPPSADETRKLVNVIVTTVDTLVSIYHSFPISQGAIIFNKLTKSIEDLIKSVKEMSLCVRRSSDLQLRCVGNVWECCEIIKKLPKDNKEASLLIFHEELSLVEDAISELTESIESGEETQQFNNVFGHNGLRFENPSATWTESDLRTVHPCLGLIKAYKSSLKKTSIAISSKGNNQDIRCISEIDNATKIIKSSSAEVDNLVLSLYPPSCPAIVRDSVLKVRNLCKDLLKEIESCHFCSESDKTWIEFLSHAAEHNYNQVTNELVV